MEAGDEKPADNPEFVVSSNGFQKRGDESFFIVVGTL